MQALNMWTDDFGAAGTRGKTANFSLPVRPYTPPTTIPTSPNVELPATAFDQVRLTSGAMFFAPPGQATKNPPYPAETND